jgi:hypothetical protein
MRARYGDVHVGAIAVRPGVPFDADQWGWTCGFYPGMEPAKIGHAVNAEQHGLAVEDTAGCSPFQPGPMLSQGFRWGQALDVRSETPLRTSIEYRAKSEKCPSCRHLQSQHGGIKANFY